MPADEIDEKILNYLKKQQWPATSEDVAKAINVQWHTAQIHLMKLMAEEKVKFRRVGRQNQWWLNKIYDKHMK